MNRESKYRGRLMLNLQWVYGEKITYKDRTFIINPSRHMNGKIWFDENCEVYPDSVGEFSGIQGIRGVDCYEHDIVKAVWSQNINDPIFGVGVVVFRCGCFMIEWIDSWDTNMELLGMIYKTGRTRVFDILGNKIQNQELIMHYLKQRSEV